MKNGQDVVATKKKGRASVATSESAANVSELKMEKGKYADIMEEDPDPRNPGASRRAPLT